MYKSYWKKGSLSYIFLLCFFFLCYGAALILYSPIDHINKCTMPYTKFILTNTLDYILNFQISKLWNHVLNAFRASTPTVLRRDCVIWKERKQSKYGWSTAIVPNLKKQKQFGRSLGKTRYPLFQFASFPS